MSEEIMRILDPGLLSSVQDQGRSGMSHLGLPQGGALDPRSSEMALASLGMKSSMPLIECIGKAIHCKFLRATNICLTGADMNWTIQGKPVVLNKIQKVNIADELKGSYAQGEKHIGYLAVDALLNVSKKYGSCSTHIGSDLGGLLLAKGTVIRGWSSAKEQLKNKVKMLSQDSSISFQPGPEYHLLKNPELLEAGWLKSSQSNRMSSLLTEQKVACSSIQIATSACFPGVVQALPDGRLNVLQVDGQTTGGYPRISVINRADLWKLAQIPPGREVVLQKSR